MKKIYTTLITIMTFASFNAMSIGNPDIPPSGSNDFEQGNIIFSFGYGAPNFGKTLAGTYVNINSYGREILDESLGPIHGKVEFALSNRFGAGLSVNYVSSNFMAEYDSLGNTYKEGWNYYSIAFNIRFNWHYYVMNNVDLYLGGGIGYAVKRMDYWEKGINKTRPFYLPMGLEFTAGGRYFFNNFFGIYAEVGAAKSIIQGGILFRL